METEAPLHKSGVLITIFCLSLPIFQPANVAQSHFIWHSLDKSFPCWKATLPFVLAGLNWESSSAFYPCLQWQISMGNCFPGCQKKPFVPWSVIPSSNPSIVIPSHLNQPVPELLKGRVGTTQWNIFNCEFVGFERNSSSWWSQNLGINRNVHDPQLQAGKHLVNKHFFTKKIPKKAIFSLFLSNKWWWKVPLNSCIFLMSKY